jgi:hypothetical protein
MSFHGFSQTVHEHQQSAKPALVLLTLQQIRQDSKRSIIVMLRHRAGIRKHYTQKLIAIAVFSLSRLEETGKIFPFYRIGIRLQFPLDICGNIRYFFR